MVEMEFKSPSGDWITWNPEEQTVKVNPSDNLTSYLTTNASSATVNKVDNMNDLCEKFLKEIKEGKEDMENKKYDFSKVINRAEKNFLEKMDKEETDKKNEIINADVNYIAAKEQFDNYVSCVQRILGEKTLKETTSRILDIIKTTLKSIERDLLTKESKEKIESIEEEYTVLKNEYNDKLNLVNGLIENIDSFTEGLQLLKEYEII